MPSSPALDAAAPADISHPSAPLTAILPETLATAGVSSGGATIAPIAAETSTPTHLRHQTSAYVFAIFCAALVLGIATFTQVGTISAERLSIAIAMLGFMIVAWLFPIPFATQSKLYLDTTVLFAAILLLPPGVAVLMAATGTGIAHAVRRRSLSESVFNTSQIAIQAAIGGIVLTFAGWSTDRLAFGPDSRTLAIVAAGIVIYLINSVLVAGVVSLETSMGVIRVWRESAAETSWSEIVCHLSQLIVGLMAAITADAQPWSVVLLLLPAITIYTSFSQYVAQRKADVERLRAADSRLSRARQEVLRHAEYDGLTGLPNRQHLLDRLDQVRSQRIELGIPASLLIVDIDRFKVVNDSLGPTTGDRLLVEVARRIREAVPEDAIVARLGADEFAVVMQIEGARPSHPGRVAQDVLDAFVTPFAYAEQEIYLTTSIGIAEVRLEHDSASEWLRDADVALFLAKQRGKSRYEVFDSASGDFSPDRVGLETDLRRAIDRQELMLYYQPIVALRTGRIEGFEALVRWKHPRRGMISPAKVISMAEETALIIPLGRWVLTEACRQGRLWEEANQLTPPTVSVNLSAKQFYADGLVEDVEKALERSGLSPRYLRLEVTESVIMDDADSSIETMRQLKALGVELAIDDFGTGYSSLAYLRRFPVDVLKVDRSFISGLGQNSEDTTITQAVVGLGRALSLIVVAEGIETIGQLVHLCSLECELGQGNHFSKPLPAKDADALLVSESLSPQPILSLPLHLAPTVA